MTAKTSNSAFPTFPSAIIHGVAEEFVNLYAPIRETPEAFLWLSFVTYLGNAVSPYIRLNLASSEPRFYGVAIGKSGRTRKSAGQNLARDLFKAARPENKQTIIEGFGSAEGLLSKLSESPGAQIQPTLVHFDEINLRRAGVAEGVIQKIGGWRTRSVFERYAIVTQTDIADAMHKLESREDGHSFGHSETPAEPTSDLASVN